MCCRTINLTFLTLTLGLATACERYRPSYQVPKSANVVRGQNPSDPDQQPPGPGMNPANDSNTEILLVSSKLLGQEAKYTAVAKFAGVTSVKLPLTKADGGIKFVVPGLPAAKSELLVVEIYEGDKLRFIAKKPKLELAAPSAKANRLRVEECLILSAPWDGAKTEGSCNWDIEEAK